MLNTEKESMYVLFCNAKDELNCREWIDWHVDHVGFTHVVLFDDMSTVCIQSHRKECRVLRIHKMKMQYLQLALSLAQRWNAEWACYLDMDEYLVFNQMKLQTFVSHFPNVSAILMSWLLYGSSFQPDTADTSHLLDNFTFCAFTTDHHVKTLFRPSQTIAPANLHTWHCSGVQVALTSFGYQRIHPVFTPDWGMCVQPIQPQCVLSLHWVKKQIPAAYIAHFQFQTYAQYLRRRVHRPRDDSGQYRPQEWCLSRIDFHNQWNETWNPIV